MTDKILHFMSGAVGSMGGGYLSKIPLLGGRFAGLVGLIKEFWDIEHGTAEFLDFVATASGAFLVMLILKYLGGL